MSGGVHRYRRRWWRAWRRRCDGCGRVWCKLAEQDAAEYAEWVRAL